MNISFYIAKRYLLAKKSTNVINIISGVSVVGVATVTTALIVVLSVMNGFNGLLTELYNSFDPDIKITPKTGKTFIAGNPEIEKLKEIKEISFFGEVIEESALLRFDKKEYVAVLKGVEDNFRHMSGVDSMIVAGEFLLKSGNTNFAVVGLGVQHFLGVVVDPTYQRSIEVYVPKRREKISQDLEKMYKIMRIVPAGVFSIQQDYDTKYVIVPIEFMRELLDYKNEITSLEIKVKNEADIPAVKEKIMAILGDGYVVKDKYEQHEFIFRIMKSEKLAIFLILSFILIIASFNIIGSLTMLIIDKKEDIGILKSLGASNSLIKRIFLIEGWMISMAGALIGLVLGALICWVQIHFGIVQLQGGGSFIISEYPVEMHWLDFVTVLAIVMGIGFVAAWYPVRYINKKYLDSVS